jgi:transcriptional regulator with XRE-family HTH domain
VTELQWRRIFADRLSYMMRQNNITQRRLAIASGTTEASISYYLSERKTPSFKVIINLAYTLNCTVEDLIDFGEPIE